MYPMDILSVAIVGVAGMIIYTRLRPGALDVQLWRSSNDRMIGGVFGGLGARLGIAPLWFRLAWCVLFFFFPTCMLLLAGYVVLWAITPLRPARHTVGGQTVINGRVVPGPPQSTTSPGASTGAGAGASTGLPAWRTQRRDPTRPW